MKSFKFDIYKAEILLIFIIGLIPLLWFKQGYLAIGHDMSYPLAPIDFWLDRLFVWTDRISSFASNQTDAVPGIFIHGLQAFFYLLTGSLQFAQKLDFIFWLTLPGITMYILLRSLHPNKGDFVVRISGSLFYMLNHYLLQAWVIAEMGKFSIVAALPIVVLAIINVVYKRKSILKNSIIVGLILFFLNGGAGIPLWGGLFVGSFTCLVVAIILAGYPIWQKLGRALIFSILVIFFVLVLNIYWIYPYVESFTQNYTQRVEMTGGSEGAVIWSSEISRNASLTNLTKMQGVPDWYDNPEHPYANNLLNDPIFIFISLIFPILGVLGLLNRKGSRDNLVYKVTFLTILIVAIPFTAGSHSPTGDVYNLMLKYLPGFSIFRTPFYKFGMVLWFAYAYLIGIGLKNVIDLVYPRVSAKFSLKLISIITLIIFLFVLGFYNYPYFTGSFFNWSKKYSTMVKVPDYLFAVKTELDNNKFSTRTLLIPDLNHGTNYEIYNWGYFSLSTIPSILSRKSVIINDATLRGDERLLVDSVYNQLAKTGRSYLLNYLGADRAIIRDDFNEKDNLNYSSSRLKAKIGQNGQFSLDKKIDQWSLISLNNSKNNPLFYIPSSITYLSVESLHFDKAVDIPDVEELGDAILFSDIVKQVNIPPKEIRDLTTQYIVEGICNNCSVTKDEILAELPRILPGSRFYFLVKFLENIKFENIKAPSDRIDFVLGTMAKNSAALEVLIRDSANKKAVEDLVDEWEKNLVALDVNYSQLSDMDQRQHNAYKIYRYLWFLIVGIQEWRSWSDSSDVVNKLARFEEKARQFIQVHKFQAPPQKRIEESKRFNINIPRNGNYQISVYSPAGLNSLVSDATKSATLDNNPIDFVRVKDGENWFQSKKLALLEKEYILNLETHNIQTVSLPGFTIETSEAQTYCKNIDLGDVNNDIKYQIKFKHQNTTNRPLRFDIFEKSIEFPDGEKIEVERFNNRISDRPVAYEVELNYNPGKFTKSAYIRFCLDGGRGLFTSASDVSTIEINKVYGQPLVFITSADPIQLNLIPDLEFVALNQTKYLVKVKTAPNKFILNFNSRFDTEWKLREIDSKLADKYFSGDKKEYLNGKVVEYERRDKHILTDFVFSRIGEEASPDVSLNTFSNGWVFDQPNSDQKVYLVEYIHQNTLYKTLAVSVLSLICIVILYINIRRYEKDD